MNRYVRCPRCGSEFCKDEPWKKICVDCWLESKGKSKSGNQSHVAELKMELDEARAKLSYYISRCRQLEMELSEKAAFPGLGEHIKDLIFLAHPDKHNNSPKATAVTAWLLDARKELCQCGPN
ncbi:hypothetical protein [Desulfovibrio sp. DV]|uniref:hypothetical protein n=1 Tax=Desulfovibrio sp. DV TaxID=1844708 RepID=UPI00094B79BA|nr:hypothetical protein [Desulfovibrio sp. DV]